MNAFEFTSETYLPVFGFTCAKGIAWNCAFKMTDCVY